MSAPDTALRIARELGDRPMVAKLLAAGGARRRVRTDHWGRRGPLERFGWLRTPAFVRGAIVGFALGQILLLGLAIIIARVVNG